MASPAPPRPAAAARPGHSFGDVRVHDAAEAGARIGRRAADVLLRDPAHPAWAELRRHASPGVRAALPEGGAAGEAVLNDTMGSSRCNLEGSAPTITNGNLTCTRPCTAAHEAQHVADWGPCCARARAAYQAPGANQPAVLAQWNAYLDGNRAWFECQAYRRSEACADTMRRVLLCDSNARVLRWVAMGAGALGGGIAGAQMMGATGAATGATVGAGVGAGAGLLGGPAAPATVPGGALVGAAAGGTAGFITGEVLGFLGGLTSGAAAGAAADAVREACCRLVREYGDNSTRGRVAYCDRAGPAPVCPF